MKKKTNYIAVLIIGAVTVITLFLSLRIITEYSNLSKGSYDYRKDLDSVSNYHDTLRVCGDKDFMPFTYLDEDGNPAGSFVEILFELARTAGFRIELTLDNWETVQKDFENGKYDVLLGASYTNSRANTMNFSGPIGEDSIVFFKKASTVLPSYIDHNSDIRIALLSGSSELEKFLEPMSLSALVTEYNTLTDAFYAVENEECDIVLTSYVNGKELIKNEDLDFSTASSELLKQTYYICSRIDDPELKKIFDSVITHFDESNYINKVNNKWASDYGTQLSISDFYENYNELFIIALIVVLLFIAIFIFIATLSFNRRNDGNKYRDMLTGLPTFNDFIRQASKLMRRESDIDFVLARTNVDDFIIVNSRYGTNTGDEFLKRMADLIPEICSLYTQKFLVTRLTGDHFCFLIPKNVFNPDKFIRHLTAEMQGLIPEQNISIRMGICDVNEKSNDLVVACDNALLALDSIKNEYSKKFAYYEENMYRKIQEESDLISGMEDAIEKGEFVVYYQPQTDYLTGKITGAEALVRWLKPEGIVSPGVFIPLFESNGIIYKLDQFVWKTACRDLSEMRNMGYDIPHISINISRHEIGMPDLSDTLLSSLSEYGLTPGDLHLEITETAYMSNSDMMFNVISDLKEKGFFVEMDDFGSGYSSLATLKSSPFDLIKLDANFLLDRDVFGRGKIIAEHVVSLLKDVGLKFLSEGVETEDQAEFLTGIGCHIMQGYFFSKPVPKNEFIEKLQLKEEV